MKELDAAKRQDIEAKIIRVKEKLTLMQAKLKTLQAMLKPAKKTKAAKKR